MKSICVYCGSSPGTDPKFMDEAIACGTLIAEAGLTLVYGGGRVGLMGAVADAALAAGGKVGLMGAVADAALAAGGQVIGVMPQDLVDAEIAHAGLTKLHIVGSMHERKLAMADFADAFLCLPGGPGTFEEIFEQWTLGLLGAHAKPCGFVNVSGYYDQMRATIQGMADAGFIGQQYVDMLIYTAGTAEAIERFRTYVAPPPKWAAAREVQA